MTKRRHKKCRPFKMGARPDEVTFEVKAKPEQVVLELIKVTRDNYAESHLIPIVESEPPGWTVHIAMIPADDTRPFDVVLAEYNHAGILEELSHVTPLPSDENEKGEP